MTSLDTRSLCASAVRRQCGMSPEVTIDQYVSENNQLD